MKNRFAALPSRAAAILLNARRHASDTVISVAGEIDIASGRMLRAEMLEALSRRKPRILLDLSGVTFVDCAGLTALLQARRSAEQRGGSLHIVAASAPVHHVVELAGLQHILVG